VIVKHPFSAPQQPGMALPAQKPPKRFSPGYPEAPYGRQHPLPQKSRTGVLIVVGMASAIVGGVVVALAAAFLLIPPFSASASDLEVKQLGDLRWALDEIAADKAKHGKLKHAPNRGGLSFYDFSLKNKLLESDVLGKIVSLTGPDAKAESTVADHESGIPLADNNCSYTAPRADELLAVLKTSGAERTVIITFNARNWDNYPEHGVVVLWSDSSKGEWLTFEEARDEWGITEEEWADPAGKLFGKKAPFQHTYE
jgi:hypothetical protein